DGRSARRQEEPAILAVEPAGPRDLARIVDGSRQGEGPSGAVHHQVVEAMPSAVAVEEALLGLNDGHDRRANDVAAAIDAGRVAIHGARRTSRNAYLAVPDEHHWVAAALAVGPADHHAGVVDPRRRPVARAFAAAQVGELAT